jgi:type IV pilus assembly protein PilC
MLLTYEAVDARGAQLRDTLEAADEREAVDQLRKRGLYVKKVARAAGAKALSNAEVRQASSAKKMPLNALVLFTRQMAMLLRAGSGIVPAISAIRRQMTRPEHSNLLGHILADLEEGVPLTDALRKHPDTFNPVYCAIVAAGEASATLTPMFERLAQMVGKQRALRNKIIGTMAYPVLLVLMSFKILLVMMFFVLPRFGGMFTQLGVTPPATTRAMLAAGTVMAEQWIWFVVGTVAAIGGVVWALMSKAGRRWMSDIQTSIPVIGRIRSRLIQALVFRTMGMLLESRVGVLDALELVRQSTRNRRFQELFNAIEESVTTGGQLCTAFEASKLVEPSICQAIRTGEDSGRLGEAMTYGADVLDESNTELLTASMKLIEPVILLGLGLVVGCVAVSLFLPLFDLTSAIK